MNGQFFNDITSNKLYYDSFKRYKITFKDGTVKYTKARNKSSAEDNVRWYNNEDHYDDIISVEELEENMKSTIKEGNYDYKGYGIVYPKSNGDGVEVYKNDEFVMSFDTEKDAEEYIDELLNECSLNESVYIVGVTNDGEKKYFNEEDNDWHEDIKDGTKYDNDSAREKWYSITKGGNAKYVNKTLGFRRVFTPVIKESLSDDTFSFDQEEYSDLSTYFTPEDFNEYSSETLALSYWLGLTPEECEVMDLEEDEISQSDLDEYYEIESEINKIKRRISKTK